ncbi:MAG: ribbon-helix-helix domain-containing protein [Bryobacteraceae bacterium]
MATRISVTLDDDQLKDVRALVRKGKAKTVSAFVKQAVKAALQDTNPVPKWLEELLEQTGGPLTDEEREWADSILEPKQPRAKTVRGRKAA